MEAVLFPLQMKVKRFLTCQARSRHFGVRSSSLNHSLGCTRPRCYHTRPSLCYAQLAKQGLVCPPYTVIWPSVAGSAFTQPPAQPYSPPGSAAVSPLRAGTRPPCQSRRAWCGGTNRDLSSWDAGCVCQCYGRWAQRPKSVFHLNMFHSPSARDTRLSHSRPPELRKPWTQKDSSIGSGRENKSCKEPEGCHPSANSQIPLRKKLWSLT